MSELSVPALLSLTADIGDELRRREVTRSSNNPAGDYAEYLFCKAFGWFQEPNSVKSYDATDKVTNQRYQVKSRRLTEVSTSRELGAIRNLEDQNFHFLAAILFDRAYGIFRAALIPHTQVMRLSTFVKHTNAWRFILRDSVWSEPGVIDVSSRLKAAALV